MSIETDFLKVAEALSSVKKQETTLPIAMKEAIVTPLLVGDDVALRTSLISPANYDKELIKLLYKHSEILDNGDPIKTNLQQFMGNLSNIDKVCLIWAIYKATYDTLGKRPIKCGGSNCDNEYNHEVKLDDLIQEDTFFPWDKDVPFNQYVHDIAIPYTGHYVYIFTSKLPSIADNNRILSLVPVDALQRTLETTGDLFTRSERLTLLVEKIAIEPKSDPKKRVESRSMQEILRAFDHFIPYDVAEKFLIEYSNEFDKYVPSFYTMVECPKCGEPNRLEVELEVELFRRIILGSSSR